MVAFSETRRKKIRLGEREYVPLWDVLNLISVKSVEMLNT
jgi:hypothetical protein